MPYTPCIKVVPTYVNNDQQNGLFGDVGTYTYTDNSFTAGTKDMRLNWQDLNYIETYYKKVHDGLAPTHEETAIMLAAGFGMSVSYKSDYTGQRYDTFLEIEYDVHSFDPDVDSWTTITSPQSQYEEMMQYLYNRIDKTASTAGFGGDIANLDGKVNSDDVDYMQDVINVESDTLPNELLYIYRKEYTATSSTYSPQQILYRVMQLHYNGVLASTNRQNLFGQDDLDTLQGLANDVFSVIKYPQDIAVWSGSDATFTAKLKKPPAYNTIGYWYRWKIGNEYKSYTQATTSPQGVTEINLTINNVELDKTGTIIEVSIYDALTDTSSAPANLEDNTKFVKRTYTATLYVANENTIDLWGDTDNNGKINILDAYKILNNFQYKRGDIDKNDIIDSKDASKALKYYSLVSTGSTPEHALEVINGAEGTLTLDDIKRGDVDMDGCTDARDASYINQIYSYSSTGYSIEQIEQMLGVTINASTLDIVPRNLGELSALIKINGVRATSFNDAVGNRILASVKDRNIHLS